MRGKLLLSCLVLGACASLGSPGEGDVALPTAGVGPFRKLASSELLGVAPYVLDDPASQYREPAALPVSDWELYLYVVAVRGGHDVLVRTHATDGRSFYGGTGGQVPPVVLAADQSWEGTELAGPSALRVGAEVRLYYAAAGGIGLARSADGRTFTKGAGPVLGNEGATVWRAPSVAQLPDGRFRMLVSDGTSIFEAESNDGAAWTRLDAEPSTAAMDPVLGPGIASGAEADAAAPFDVRGVTDPCLAPRVTAAGRLHFRVLYTGIGDGTTAIGYAARFGDQGPLVRAQAPVFSASTTQSAPAFFEVGGLSLMYVHDTRKGAAYPALVGALAPAPKTLPPPVAYADSP